MLNETVTIVASAKTSRAGGALFHTVLHVSGLYQYCIVIVRGVHCEETRIRQQNKAAKTNCWGGCALRCPIREPPLMVAAGVFTNLEAVFTPSVV